MNDKVLISAEELERLKACELSLYFLHTEFTHWQLLPEPPKE